MQEKIYKFNNFVRLLFFILLLSGEVILISEYLQKRNNLFFLTLIGGGSLIGYLMMCIYRIQIKENRIEAFYSIADFRIIVFNLACEDIRRIGYTGSLFILSQVSKPHLIWIQPALQGYEEILSFIIRTNPEIKIEPNAYKKLKQEKIVI